MQGVVGRRPKVGQDQAGYWPLATGHSSKCGREEEAFELVLDVCLALSSTTVQGGYSGHSLPSLIN